MLVVVADERQLNAVAVVGSTGCSSLRHILAHRSHSESAALNDVMQLLPSQRLVGIILQLSRSLASPTVPRLPKVDGGP